MVVQGKGGWKGADTKAKPANNASNNKPQQQRQGGAHTLSSLDNTAGSPSNQQQRGSNAGQAGSQHMSLMPHNDFSSDADAPPEKRIPEMYGRPRQGFSFREMCFPWYKLLSATTVIAVINLLFFIAELIYGGVAYTPQEAFVKSNKNGGPSSLVLKDLGAKFAPLIVDGHVYRLIVPVFMHSGIIHIFFNSYFLTHFGYLCEARMGTLRFLAGYLFAGIMGNVYSTIFSRSSVSVGASGALYGMLCLNLYFAIRHWDHMRSACCEVITLVMILLFTFLIGFLGEGTDNAAHLFGAISGFLIAVCIIPFWFVPSSVKREKIVKILASIFTLAYAGVSIALIWILA